MSPELRDHVAVALEELRELLATYRDVIQRSRATAPSAVEAAALGALLHSFYTGIENIFKRIAVDHEGGPPAGDTLHRALLDAAATPVASRPLVISTALRDRLLPYLSFRHVFRHAYTFQLRWPKMAMLVWECEATLEVLETELRAFLGLHGEP